MDLMSLNFVMFAAGFIFLYNLSSSMPYRSALFAAANCVFFLTYTTDINEILPLFCFVVFCFFSIEIVYKYNYRGIFYFSIILLILIFCSLKKYVFIPDALQINYAYMTIGVSYILFRVLHVIVDVHDQALEKPLGPLGFFNYTCNFLSLVAGPIQRVQDFVGTVMAPPAALSETDVFRAFSRFITGFLKVLVLSGAANYLFRNLQDTVVTTMPSGSALEIYIRYASLTAAYTTYLYFNFSLIFPATWIL